MRYHLQPGCLRVLEGADPGGQFRSVQLLGLGQGLGHYLHTPVTGQTGQGLFLGQGEFYLAGWSLRGGHYGSDTWDETVRQEVLHWFPSLYNKCKILQ